MFSQNWLKAIITFQKFDRIAKIKFTPYGLKRLGLEKYFNQNRTRVLIQTLDF